MTFNNRIAEVDLLREEIIAQRPLNAHVLQQLVEYYRIGLTYSSNALEGNSLTETETKIILEDGITIGGKPMREHLEALGHSQAYNRMIEFVGKTHLSEAEICNLHYLFYHMIACDQAGTYRTQPVIVTGSTTQFPPPSQIASLMQEFVQQSHHKKQTLHPIEYAAWAHIRLVTIHPFIDGNGRTARLIMNLLLLSYGYVITCIPPVLRREYLSATQAGNTGNMQPFVALLSNMVYEAQKDYMRMIKSLSTY